MAQNSSYRGSKGKITNREQGDLSQLDVFKDIYPTPNTGAPLDAEDQKDWMGIKGDESRLVRCRKCGWICDPDRDMEQADGSFAGKGVDWLNEPELISNQVAFGLHTITGTWTDVWTETYNGRGGVYEADDDYTSKYIWAYLWLKGEDEYQDYSGVGRVDVLNDDATATLVTGVQRNIYAKYVDPDATSTSTDRAQGWYRFELPEAYSFTSGTSYLLAVFAEGDGDEEVMCPAGTGYYYSGGAWSPSAKTCNIFVAKSGGMIPGNQIQYNVGNNGTVDYYKQPTTVGGCPCCGTFLYRNKEGG